LEALVAQRTYTAVASGASRSYHHAIARQDPRLPAEQRRLAAILAADVVGYSRLMGRDESGTVARLRAIRKQLVVPTVTRRGGRIVKLTGDGVLAEFGSAVEALTAAIELQQAMHDAARNEPADHAIVLRMGLHV